MESSIVVIDLQKPAEDSAGFCYTNFMFVIIDSFMQICYTVSNHTPGGVYD